jgi:hypothetical protein
MEKCRNHPLRFASGRCKRCHTPICNDCRIQVEEGIFCSDPCIEQFRSFQSRMSGMGTTTRSSFSILGFLKSTVIAAVLIVVIVGVFYLRFGVDSWDKFVDLIKSWFKLMW